MFTSQSSKRFANACHVYDIGMPHEQPYQGIGMGLREHAGATGIFERVCGANINDAFQTSLPSCDLLHLSHRAIALYSGCIALGRVVLPNGSDNQNLGPKMT